MHSIARIDAENVSACLCASPIEIPVIVGSDLHPSALLEVVQQHRLVHVRAEANLHSLVLIVGDSEGNFPGKIGRNSIKLRSPSVHR